MALVPPTVHHPCVGVAAPAMRHSAFLTAVQRRGMGFGRKATRRSHAASPHQRRVGAAQTRGERRRLELLQSKRATAGAAPSPWRQWVGRSAAYARRAADIVLARRSTAAVRGALALPHLSTFEAELERVAASIHRSTSKRLAMLLNDPCARTSATAAWQHATALIGDLAKIVGVSSALFGVVQSIVRTIHSITEVDVAYTAVTFELQRLQQATAPLPIPGEDQLNASLIVAESRNTARKEAGLEEGPVREGGGSTPGQVEIHLGTLHGAAEMMLQVVEAEAEAEVDVTLLGHVPEVTAEFKGFLQGVTHARKGLRRVADMTLPLPNLAISPWLTTGSRDMSQRQLRDLRQAGERLAADHLAATALEEAAVDVSPRAVAAAMTTATWAHGPFTTVVRPRPRLKGDDTRKVLHKQVTELARSLSTPCHGSVQAIVEQLVALSHGKDLPRSLGEMIREECGVACGQPRTALCRLHLLALLFRVLRLTI